MKTEKQNNTRTIVRLALMALFLVLGRLMTPYSNEQFVWHYIGYTPLLFLIYLSFAGKKQNTLKERSLILAYITVFAMLLQLIMDGFKLNIIVSRLIPVLLGAVVTIPLLFINVLYKKS